MANVVDAIKSPYTLVQAAYNEALSAAGNGLAPRPWPKAVSSKFATVFADDAALSKVPVLTSAAIKGNSIPPNSLVRCVGMVQDVFGLEIFTAAMIEMDAEGSRHVTPGAFRDVLLPSATAPATAVVVPGKAPAAIVSSVHAETYESRTTYNLVPIPAEAAWAKSMYASGSSSGVSAGPSEGTAGSSPSAAAVPAGGSARKGKRGHDDDDDDAQAGSASTSAAASSASAAMPAATAASAAADFSMAGGSASSSSSAAVPAAPASMVHPLVSSGDVPILCRCYGGAEGDGEDGDADADATAVLKTMRIGEMVEVIGIYTHDPVIASFDQKAAASLAGGGCAHGCGAGAGATGGCSHCGRGSKRAANGDGTGGDGSGSADHAMLDDGDDVEAITAAMMEGVLFDDDEYNAKNPSPAAVPRVHAVLVRPLTSTFPVMQPSMTATANVSLPLPPSSSPAAAASSSSPSPQKQASVPVAVAPFGLRGPSEPVLPSHAPAPSAEESAPSSSSGAQSPSRGQLMASAGASPSKSPSSPTKQRLSIAAINAENARSKIRLGLASKEVLNQSATTALASMSASLRMEPPACMASIGSEIASFFAACLGGDELAARYLTLFIVSQLIVRKDYDLIGKITMHVAGLPDSPMDIQSHEVPKPPGSGNDGDEDMTGRGAGAGAGRGKGKAAADDEAMKTTVTVYDPVLPLEAGGSHAGRMLHAAMASLTPRCALVPLRVDNLNGLQFYPSKDVDTGRVTPGVLQVANGTVLVVDETTMTEGKLEAIGVKNLSTLQNVAVSSQVPYDFTYYSTQFDVEAPVLLLTHSNKSMLKGDLTVPLSLDARARLEESAGAAEAASSASSSSSAAGTAAGNPVAAVAALASSKPGFLDRARAFVAIAKTLPYSLPADTAKEVEDEIVRLRQVDRAITEDYIHVLISLARLNALCHGETSLSIPRWRETCQLEVERKGRVAAAAALAAAASGGAGGGAGPRVQPPVTPTRTERVLQGGMSP